MRLSVSLLNSSESGLLDAWGLKPWLTHLEALLGVGTEEWHVGTKLVELNEKIVLRNTSVAWNIVSSVDNTSDTEAEKLVDGKLNIFELGVVAAGGNGTISLGAEEERAREKERSLLATVTTEESLEGSTLLKGTIGVMDPSVLENVTIRGHVSVAHGHANLRVVVMALEHGWLVHVVPDTVHVVGALEDGWVEEILPVVASAIVEEINPDG